MGDTYGTRRRILRKREAVAPESTLRSSCFSRAPDLARRNGRYRGHRHVASISVPLTRQLDRPACESKPRFEHFGAASREPQAGLIVRPCSPQKPGLHDHRDDLTVHGLHVHWPPVVTPRDSLALVEQMHLRRERPSALSGKEATGATGHLTASATGSAIPSRQHNDQIRSFYFRCTMPRKVVPSCDAQLIMLLFLKPYSATWFAYAPS